METQFFSVANVRRSDKPTHNLLICMIFQDFCQGYNPLWFVVGYEEIRAKVKLRTSKLLYLDFLHLGNRKSQTVELGKSPFLTQIGTHKSAFIFCTGSFC